MLNEKKIKRMTHLSLFEEKMGKDDIKLSKFYKRDYVRMEVLKAIVSITVAYLLILTLIVIFRLEYIIAKAVVLDYKQIGLTVLGIYIILLVIYGIGGIIGYNFKYKKSRKSLLNYYNNLKELRHIYKEEDRSKEG